ncbi:1-(5-phosphoribosyl)-5-[(5-phosphoribosylamino)methylideneamino] imidazole-4-carboxamide isomerase [Buchnera aphidicola (Takecallis arundicolens)]|uniref:1-(5-phosphoribosyl)-5-[(5- phosphoribosylamino)methylideneamino] imidazole-4-carboxamide isomerase n=1 Tax=Buchnera aphidicola TaxID=9 RepID=UPI003463FF9D
MIIPAIDILNGKIVRLYQGNYNLVQYYDHNIYNLIEQYLLHGASIIHIVDLESARADNHDRNKIFNKIVNTFGNYIQFAGGIRSEKDIEYLLLHGVKRIVLGTAIINQVDQVKNWIKYYGSEYIVAALDVNIKNNINSICIHGWKKDTKLCLEDVLENLSTMGIKYVLCTDISKDGTLLGPNITLYNSLIQQFPKIFFQSSGGVCSLNDIIKLKEIGVNDIILGKSLLENKFTLLEAIQCWQKGLSPALM